MAAVSVNGVRARELKPEVAAQIERAAEQDPALATEIAEIRSMVDQLSELYKHETAGIEATAFVGPGASAEVSQTNATSVVDPQTVNTASKRKLNWTAAAGLLAMAASLLIAVALAAPTLREYFNQPRDVLANADAKLAETDELASRVAQAKATNTALEQQVDTAEQALSEEVALRRLTVSEQQLRRSEVNLKDDSFIDSLNDIDHA